MRLHSCGENLRSSLPRPDPLHTLGNSRSNNTALFARLVADLTIKQSVQQAW